MIPAEDKAQAMETWTVTSDIYNDGGRLGDTRHGIGFR
jgi:hypothetical protein